jgi:hypothetical protein
MQDGKIAIVEEEAELVRAIYRRYLELGDPFRKGRPKLRCRRHPHSNHLWMR